MVMPVEPVPDNSLRGKIINTLLRIYQWMCEQNFPELKGKAPNAWDAFRQNMVRGADSSRDPLQVFLEQWAGFPPEVVAPIIASLSLPGVPLPAKYLGLASLFVSGCISGILTGPIRLVSMEVMRRFRAARPSVMQVAMADAQQLTPPPPILKTMEEMGFPNEWIPALLLQGLNFPSVGQVQELLNRGEIDAPQAREWLRYERFTPLAREKLLALRMEIPNIQDLIRFAVREAFSPVLAEMLGLYQEFPEALMADAAKRGLSEHYARMFWAAHWQLPSVSQAFEMMHRRSTKTDGTPFVEDDMRNLLKVQDYSPVWRDLLIQIAFRPYTRRELPRLFKLGVIDEAGMKSAYMDIGLSPERAQVLVDASIREAREASRDLTRADIEAGYKRRLISPEAAAAALGTLGYAEDEVAYILARDDYDKAQATATSRKTTIKRRYISGLIDHELAIRQLSEAGVEAEEIPDLIAEWTEERESKVERPSIDKCEEMYRRRIISGPDLAAELAGHGYNDRYIQLMMANIEAEIAEENARKSEAQKRREAVRVKLPTKADLLDWLQAGIITQDDMRQRMRDQHYLDEDIDRYLREEGIVVAIPTYRTEEGKVRVATLKLVYRQAGITELELLSGLLDLEVPPSLADAIVEYETLRLPPPPVVPVVVPVPFYRTEEGRVRLATLKAQVREGLISLGELVSGLLALEVPPSLADALAEYEEVKLGPAAA